MQPIHELGELRIAAECCVVHGDQVLVQRRPATAKFFPDYLTFPGGHVDAGEDLVSSVVREVAEETGVELIKEQVVLRVSAINHHIDRGQIWMAFGFHAVVADYSEPISTDEGEVLWMPIAEFRQSDKVFPPIKYYLNHLFDSDKVLYMSSICEGGAVKEVTSEVKV